MTMNTRTLLDMLTYGRPAGSGAEREFRQRWLLTLPDAFVDAFDNVHIRVGVSRTIWSAHTDTVHRRSTRQKLTVAENVVRLHPMSASNCLGADDTAGVWIMREMILAGVPGYYVFHHAEERGGIGSAALMREHGEWFAKHFDRCIAFDRCGTRDIITHQGCLRTASDGFARDLALVLNTDSAFGYRPCADGIFTDSDNYADDVPECTNISVGYYNEHTSRERLDLGHVHALCARVIAAGLDGRFETLPTLRDKTVRDWDIGICDRTYGGMYAGAASLPTQHRRYDDARGFLDADYASVHAALMGHPDGITSDAVGVVCSACGEWLTDDEDEYCADCLRMIDWDNETSTYDATLQAWLMGETR